MPSVKHISASQSTLLLASLPANVEAQANVFSQGRLQAGRAQFNKRPQAASGAANNSRFAARCLNYKTLNSARWAAAACKSTLRPNHRSGSKHQVAQLQSGAQPSTLNQPQALPNPSLKRTPNGIAFWPRKARCAHNASRGQNTTPSVAA